MRRLTAAFVLLAAATFPNVATARASAPSFCGELGGDWDGQYCHTTVTSERNAVREIKVALPDGDEVYTHIEGLVGEENELLEEAEESRKEEHRKRLHAIGEELDRAWETLRRRADRRAKPGS